MTVISNCTSFDTTISSDIKLHVKKDLGKLHGKCVSVLQQVQQQLWYYNNSMQYLTLKFLADSFMNHVL